jgi:hypothetical protein
VHDPFSESEAGGQFAIVTRRPHDNGDALTFYLDLERFFDCDFIRLLAGRVSGAQPNEPVDWALARFIIVSRRVQIGEKLQIVRRDLVFSHRSLLRAWRAKLRIEYVHSLERSNGQCGTGSWINRCKRFQAA